MWVNLPKRAGARNILKHFIYYSTFIAHLYTFQSLTLPVIEMCLSETSLFSALQTLDVYIVFFSDGLVHIYKDKLQMYEMLFNYL